MDKYFLLEPKALFSLPLTRKISQNSPQPFQHQESIQTIEMKGQTLSTIEDFRGYISGQTNSRGSLTHQQPKQFVSSDYQSRTTNLPKIKLIIQQKSLNGYQKNMNGPGESNEARSNIHQSSSQAYQMAKPVLDFQNQEMSKTLQRPLKDSFRVNATTSLQPRTAIDNQMQNNFYSTFNFKVMHSRSTDFMSDEINPNGNKLLPKQFGGIVRAGGSQFKDWSVQTALIKEKPNRPVEYQAARYRNFAQKTQENDLGEFSLESYTDEKREVQLKRFESIMQSKSIDSPTDFNFKTKTKKTQSTNLTIDQTMNVGQRESIFQSYIPLASTEHSLLFDQTGNFKDSLGQTTEELSRYWAKTNVSSILVAPEMPRKVQSKCKSLIQKKLSESRPVQPQLLKQLLKKQRKQVDDKSQEEKLIYREEKLKRRPVLNRPSSALARTQVITSQMNKKGFDLNPYQQKFDIEDGEVSTRQTSEQLDHSESIPYNQQRLLNYSTSRFNQSLSRAALPRLTTLALKNESKDFKIKLANQQFNHIYNRCSTSQDRKVINDAYQYFHDEVSKQLLQNKPLKDVQVEVEHSTSDSSSDVGSQIGDLLNQRFDEQTLQKRLMKSLQKGLIKYRRGLQAKVDSINFQQLTEQLDFQSIALEQMETERLRQKRMPIKGEDLPLAALSAIFGFKEKVQRNKFDLNVDIRAYTNLLEQNQTEEVFGKPKVDNKQPKLIPKLNQLEQSGTGPQPTGRIKRGFLLFPNSLDVENIDLDEEIDDPELMFDNYVQRLEKEKTAIGQDFMTKFEDQRISGIYNFNSTIYEKNPTARVAFFTNCKRQLELALPILSKIKNGELILNDYRLEHGHFEALVTSFVIQPDSLTKITLNNCGLDDQSCSSLFKALRKLTRVEYIQITKAEIGQSAITELTPLLTNSGGWGLTDFKLKDVKIQPTNAEILFKIFVTRCYLKTFSLVNFNFTERTFGLFTEYFSINPCLQHLDISYASGLRPQSYLKFMDVLSRNKQLHSLDISWNNFIEDQPAAFTQLQNPYKLFKAMYEKWIKMGPGARWPGKPDPKVVGAPPKTQRKQPKPTPKGGRIQVQVQEFDLYDKTEEIPHRMNLEQSDNLMSDQQKEEINTEIQITRLVKQCLLYAFQRRMIKAPMFGAEQEKVEVQPAEQKQKEEVSTMAMVVTEAIYKFIRRNQKLQHLNISRCNLSQVMLGRIGLGIKCSKTVIGAHFSENPGVTPALKAFLQLKMKAVPPQKAHEKINNMFIEQDCNLEQMLQEQIATNQADFSLAHETILLREQNRKNLDITLPSDPSMAANKTLVFTRLLGHKLQIPNSGRWQILTNPSQDCWICKKYIVSLIFWSPLQIAQQQVPDSFINKSKIEAKLNQNLDVGNPFIYGQFSNWAPVRMRSVKELAELPRSFKTPNFMPFIIKKFNLGPGYDSIHDLKSEHLEFLKLIQAAYEKDFELNWRRYISSMLKFSQTCMVNYEFLKPNTFTEFQNVSSFDDLESNPIFVHAALLKPGKQHYMVQQNRQFDVLPTIDSRSHESFTSSDFESFTIPEDVDEMKQPEIFYGIPKRKTAKFNDEKKLNRLDQQQIIMEKGAKELISEFFLHRNIIPQRTEQIPVMQKMIVEQVAIRQFYHRLSVFAPWKPDNVNILARCAENDLIAMNLGKYLKNDEEKESLLKVIKKHMSYLKELHLDLVSESDIPPFVSFLDFVNFTHDCNLVNEVVKQASIELIYVQVDTNNKFRNGIIRGEFIEALIRIAKAKYMDTGIEKKFDAALEMLIEKCIKPNMTTDRWQKLRDKRFWNNEINDILQANLDGIQRVHKKFWDLKRLPKKKFMEMKECEYLVTETPLKINLKSVKRAYVLSKMTCSDEQTKLESYNRLMFVEFLEFLCRIALEIEDESLGKTSLQHLQRRLEVVLDHVLAYIDVQRKEVVMETLMDSDADLSDCDY